MVDRVVIKELRRALEARLGRLVLADEPLSRHTSFRIGGPADLFITVRSTDELCTAVDTAREHGVPVFLLGRGTNILVSDQGIRGLVVANRCQSLETRFGPIPRRRERETGIRTLLTHAVRVEAGAPLPWLVHRAAEQELGGLEWAVGIPGSLGGAVLTNAGAYGSSLADVLYQVTVLMPSGHIQSIPAEELRLGYRTSRLRAMPQAERPLILEVELILERRERDYLRRRMAEYSRRRRESQPGGPSAGSVFKNPPTAFAWRLIDAVGLRGHRIGGAQISEKHTNFIINLGGATAADVKALIDLARTAVYERFGVELELEIELVGEW